MKVVAHRGAPRLAPENTMAAFRLARELGADAVELDVHATADGALVVLHDHALDRTTSGTGFVFEATLAEIARLDAGAWFSAEFTGEPVPRLGEVLALDDLEFEVELKIVTREALRDALALVEQAGVLARTEFTSSNVPLLMALREHCPSARTGMFCARRSDWMAESVFEHAAIGAATFAPVDVFHVHAHDITSAMVDRLHQMGRVAHAYDATTPEGVRWALECGADQISTDDLQVAVPLVRA